MSETPKFGGAANDKTRSGSSSAKSRVVSVNPTVNGQPRTMTIEPRTTLLDALRENLTLTGTKKACDRGECGACTVHIDGRRVLSCMTLAAMQEGKKITTIEGLEQKGTLTSASVSVHRARRIPMRFLHLGPDHVRGRHDRRGESRLAERRQRGRANAVYSRRPLACRDS
jgi:Aerobic-type carbon monoxide dehydrogenase, small subunit CoxS/CutS homologs